MKLRYLTIIATFGFCISLNSCGDQKEEPEAVKEVSDDKKKEDPELDREKRLIRDMFSAIPSPLSMAYMLKEAGAEYDPELVHDPELVADYINQKSQALNLGIYGADMNFANLMDRKPETIKYMGATLTLYDKLGISKAIDEDLMEKLRSNQEEKDSMMAVIIDSYSSLEGYLKENGETELAAYIMAGGVVEALYIASHVSKQNDVLMQRVADQKYAIESLVELLQSISEDADIASVLEDINRLKAVYDSMEVVKVESENKEADDGVMVIGAKQKINITPEQLAEISTISGEIREKYIAQ